MQLRVARHTNNLNGLKSFYIDVLGFHLLGEFQNHQGYDGILIGKTDQGWHLEFTQSGEAVNHTFDEDDILVFYPETVSAYDSVIGRLGRKGIEFMSPKNPYWGQNGKMFSDPDGYRIIISDLKT